MDWTALHLDWIVVAGLVAFAGQAAWEDFRTGRIRNAILARMLFLGAVWLWVLAVTVGLFELDPKLIWPAVSLPQYLFATFRNTAIALAVGVILWFARLWAAGDSKLFPLIALLLPLRFYVGDGTVKPWPAFVLFYNFVLATMLIILVDLARRGVQALVAWRRAARERDPDTPPPKPLLARFVAGVRAHAADWGRFALMLVLVLMFIKTLRHYLNDLIGLVVHLDQTIVYVVLFFLCHPIIHLMRHTWVLVTAAAVDIVLLGVALFTDWVPGLTIGTMFYMSLMAFGLMFFRMLYDAYQERMDYVNIEVDELAPKMILAETVARRLREDKGYFESQELELGPLLPDGLHPEQVPLVQRWIRERLPGEPVPIQKTFPMGPPIFVGLVLTIIFQDYAVHLPR